MSRDDRAGLPDPHALPEGAYAADVRAQRRTRCLHLMTKEAFTGIPSAHEKPFGLDEPLWWCDRTQRALGPDGSAACRDACHGPGRACYVPPIRL